MNKPIHFVTNKLKQYREERDWTQRQLADFLTLQLGRPISRVTVNYWENQSRGLMAEDAIELAKALSVPTAELFVQKSA